MRSQQDERHGGGEGEVRGVGVLRSSQKIAAQTQAQHAYGGCGEGTAEEAHGGAGEVGDVAEGEVVGFGASGHGEEGDDVGAWCGECGL